MNDMAGVIERHRLVTGETWDGDYYQFCTCQQEQMPELDGRYADHLAAALSAAGFGPVQKEPARELKWLRGERKTLARELDSFERQEHTTVTIKYLRRFLGRTRNDDQ